MASWAAEARPGPDIGNSSAGGVPSSPNVSRASIKETRAAVNRQPKDPEPSLTAEGDLEDVATTLAEARLVGCLRATPLDTGSSLMWCRLGSL